MARVRIAEFGIIQKALAGASVAVYVADDSGESTGTLATLYQAATGSPTRSNPQVLDDDGKLEADCYVDSVVVAAIDDITLTAERSVRKIRVNPLQYPLPVTSSNYNAQSINVDDIAAAIPFGYAGPWVTATAYARYNVVQNGGSSYVCTVAHTSGASTEPGVGVGWQTTWEIFASKGSAGAGTGDMLAANNLSDVVAATAFSNIKQAATQAVSGVMEIATDAEMQAGVDTERAATPAGLQAVTATVSRKGVIELATSSESIAGTDTERAVTPAGLAATIAASGNIAATQAEQETGTNLTKFVSPGRQHNHQSAFKVWCSFLWSGGVPTISSSYNISSLTDNGSGDVTFNFTVPFSDALYAWFGAAGGTTSSFCDSPYANTSGAKRVTYREFSTANATDRTRDCSFAAVGDQ